MADYHSLLTRAVANLPSGGTPATREAIYVRARKALIEQLRSLRPPLPESDIAREENALDAAIAKIEANFTPQQAARPPLPRRGSAFAPGRQSGRFAAAFAETRRADRAASIRGFAAPGYARVDAAAPIGRVSRQPRRAAAARSSRVAGAGRVRSTGGSAANAAAAHVAAAGPTGCRARAASLNRAGGQAGRRAAACGSFAPARPQPAVAGARPPPSVATRTGAASSAGARTPGRKFPRRRPISRRRLGRPARMKCTPPRRRRSSRPARTNWCSRPWRRKCRASSTARARSCRQDLEGQRPIAPGIDAGKPKPWLWIAAAVALGIVLAVAGAAILMRQKPQDLAIKPPVEATAPRAAEPPAKIAERVEAPGDPCGASAPSRASRKPTIPAAQGAAPANPAAEAQNPAGGAQRRASRAAPSAGRAAMLVASADNPQKPVVSLGSTVWSLIPRAPGQPATVAVKAEADIPDLKMHATMTLRKNTDPTLQATHTIDLKFSFADGAPITGFKDVGLPQMRMEDSTAAEALTSVKVKISDVYFLIALAKGESDTARNLDLMKTRAWFDFPLLLNDDRIAKVVFQKSPEGQAMLEKAFDAWK